MLDLGEWLIDDVLRRSVEMVLDNWTSEETSTGVLCEIRRLKDVVHRKGVRVCRGRECQGCPPQKPSYVRDVEGLKLFIENRKAVRA